MTTEYFNVYIPKKRGKAKKIFVFVLTLLMAMFLTVSATVVPSTIEVGIPREVEILKKLPLQAQNERKALREFTTEPESIERLVIDSSNSYALRYWNDHDLGVTASKIIPLGEYRLTFYCACNKCCGKSPGDKGYGITRSGTTVQEGRTIAVDSNVIPLGTQIYIKGFGLFTAEDTGSGIDGNSLDIFMDEHDEAWNCGVAQTEVYIVKGVV